MIMPNRLSTGIVAAATLVLLLLPLGAVAREPFDAKAFEQAQAAGKTVLIDVYASWCPVCKKQQPTIARIEKEKPGLIVYEVNFDSDKSVLKTFGVQAQATLIVFKGAKEVGRSTGESDPGRIQALVEKGL
jgi:thioredoxin 1